jgi:hypothetical protein
VPAARAPHALTRAPGSTLTLPGWREVPGAVALLTKMRVVKPRAGRERMFGEPPSYGVAGAEATRRT